jgi:hypothetical protein
LQLVEASQEGPPELWPENVPVVAVFTAMGSQWVEARKGGVTGLRYEALPAVMRYCRIARQEEAAVFAGLRVMEREASKWINARAQA